MPRVASIKDGRNTTVEPFDTPGAWSGLCEDQEGAVWLAGDSDVGIWRDGNYEALDLPLSANVRKIFPDRRRNHIVLHGYPGGHQLVAACFDGQKLLQNFGSPCRLHHRLRWSVPFRSGGSLRARRGRRSTQHQVSGVSEDIDMDSSPNDRVATCLAPDRQGLLLLGCGVRTPSGHSLLILQLDDGVEERLLKIESPAPFPARWNARAASRSKAPT